MNFDLHVSKRTFEGLLTEYNKLEIPDFQRPYEWKPEHWSDLWNDLIENLDQNYLMGGIVLCGSDNENNLVIDGQQRISTITLLIAGCRDYLWRECGEDAKVDAMGIHDAYIVSGGVVAEKHEPYIILGEVDCKWFEKHIQVSPRSIDEYLPPDLENAD